MTPESSQHSASGTFAAVGSSNSPERGNSADSNVVTDQLQGGSGGIVHNSHLETDLELGDLSTERLHLLYCIERGTHGFELHIEPIKHITDDRQLFRTLRQSYVEQRGRFRPYWSLRTVDSIHFMKVSMVNHRLERTRFESIRPNNT